MNIICACEKSGKVRDAFIKLGHNAISCDLQPSDSQMGKHHQGDIFDLLGEPCDLFIAFPPCTYLTVSSNKWYKDQPPRKSGALVGEWRRQARKEGADFFMKMINWPSRFVAVENPVGIMSTEYRKPDQIIQPWMFGHGETKATCLWLKGLPKLIPTNIVEGREGNIWKMSPSKDRQNLSSATYDGIAGAMANQWSNFYTQLTH